MAVAVLTLPRRYHLSAVVLSTPVAMCYSGAMCEAKIWRWAMYAASSRSLMVKKPWRLLSVKMLARMAVLNVSRNTCHSLDGI